MKQMVYVVLDNGEVVGVYDEYSEAEAVASETATITPVIVGQTDDCRVGCETPSEVITAMEHELQNLSVLSDEDEDEDEYDDDEDDEDIDPIEELVYEMDGQRVISKDDAGQILQTICDVVMADRRVPEYAKKTMIEQMMLEFAKEHEIWGVDMRE